MNTLDIILLIPILWSTYKGFRKGLVYEIATFLALLLGVYGAVHFSGIAEEFIKATLGENIDHISLIAFGVTFLAIVIGIHFLGKLLDRTLKMVALGFLNRLAGAIFGLMKVLVIMGAVLILIRVLSPESGNILPQGTKEGSLIFRNLEKGVTMVMESDSSKELEEIKGMIDP